MGRRKAFSKVSEQIEPLPLIPRGTSLDEKLSIAKRRGEKRTLEQEKLTAETPRQLFLPGFEIGTMPNHINRSSLIAPIARGQRKFHRQASIVTRRDCKIEYTGEQLDEADGEIIMVLIFLAQPYKLGSTVPLNRAELLRTMKRNTGKQNYLWLHSRLKALREATLFLEAIKPNGSVRYRVGSTIPFNIIEWYYDERSETYFYKLDPRWIEIFGVEYSRIDWDKRMQIGRGKDMAKTIQRLVAGSSNAIQYYELNWLKEKMMYASPMRKFREALLSAVDELVRLDIIARGEINVSTKGQPQLKLWRNPVDN